MASNFQSCKNDIDGAEVYFFGWMIKFNNRKFGKVCEKYVHRYQ